MKNIRRINLVAWLLVAVIASAGCKTHPASKSIAVKKKPSQIATRQPSPALTNSFAEPTAEALAHFAAGISYEANTNNAIALSHFEKSADMDAGNAALIIELSRQYIERKQTQKALALLTRAAKHPNATPEVYGWLAQAYLKAGKTNEAITASRHAMETWPSALEGYRSLASTYLQIGDAQSGLKILNRAAKVSDADAKFLVGLADFYAEWVNTRTKDFDAVKTQAIALLDRASTMKLDVDLTQNLADVYNHFGETKKASKYYLEVLAEDTEPSPTRDAIREELANIYLQSNDRKGAYEQLEGIVRDNPTRYPQAWFQLGILAYDDKNFVEAARNFEKAILLKPDLQRAYYNLALTQIDLQRANDALKTVATANEKFKNTYFDEYYTAIIDIRLKKFKDAVLHFTTAEVIAKVKDATRLNYDFYFQYGAACERTRDYEQAEKCFLKCIDQSPDAPEANNYLGFMWAEHNKNLEKAREYIERAVKKEPKSAAYADSMGWVLFKLHHNEEALSWILKAQLLSPEADATLLDHLGDVYMALHEEGKARDAWKKSLSLESNAEVQKKLASGKPPGAP
jgi:tetratricopeptide (TPR) repeat protein